MTEVNSSCRTGRFEKIDFRSAERNCREPAIACGDPVCTRVPGTPYLRSGTGIPEYPGSPEPRRVGFKFPGRNSDRKTGHGGVHAFEHTRYYMCTPGYPGMLLMPVRHVTRYPGRAISPLIATTAE
eukprot:3058108-Rhodomonas_salina.1